MKTTTEKLNPRIFFELRKLQPDTLLFFPVLATTTRNHRKHLRFLFLLFLCVVTLRSYSGTPFAAIRHHTLLPQTSKEENSLPASGLTIGGSVTAVSRDLSPGKIDLSISGGTAPYKVDWSNFVVPAFNDVITTMYNGFDKGDTVLIDSARIHHQIDSLQALTKNSNLFPNVYFAKVTDANGITGYAAGVVGRPVNWLFDGITENIGIQSSVSKTRIAGGVTLLPAEGSTIVLNAKQAGLEFGYAISEEQLYFNDYQYLELEAPSAASDIRCGYAVVDNQNAATPGDMKYYLQFSGNTVSVYANGMLNSQSNFVPGDVFALEVRNGNLMVYQNYSTISAGDIPVNTKEIYQVKTLLHDVGSVLTNLKVVSAATLDLAGNTPIAQAELLKDRITAVVNDVTCGNTCSGSITATASIIKLALLGSVMPKTIPVSFGLYPIVNGNVASTPIATAPAPVGFSTTFSNLCPGDYQVKFGYTYNNAGYVLTANFSVGYAPDWTGITNVSIDPTVHSVFKNLSSSNCDGGAYSVNELSYSTSTTEWFEFSGQCNVFNQFSYLEKLRVGLTSNSSAANLANTNPGLVQYGISFNFYLTNVIANTFPISIGMNAPAGWIYVYVNPPTGPGMAYFGNSFTMADRFKISKTGNALNFYQNNNLIPGTSPYTISSNDAMRIDLSNCEKTSAVIKPRSSFGCVPPPVYAILKRQLDGQCYRVNQNKLYFKYDEEYQDSDSKLLFNIYNGSHDKVVNGAALGTLRPDVAYGDNRYLIDLNNLAYSNNLTLPAGYYILEVINEKKEPWFLRFQK